MKFQVIDIRFDFEQDDGNFPSIGVQDDIIQETRTTIWDADDEDDLVEEITCATGWLVEFIDYVHVLV